MNHLIIGTAGHVDHGKTTLIKNLTGTDTDRLKEEKERQLTIDLGYAFLNKNIAFIDVPGHEKFIKNMVAGAATVNFALLVIAADDGIMPQTVEHLQILEFLGIRDGVVVITKTDLVTEKLLTQRKDEIRNFTQGTFLQNSPVFHANGQRDENIVELDKYLRELPKKKLDQNDANMFRMPIDRAFSMKGFGNVVTGTVTSGQYELNQKNLILYPENYSVTVRNMESQNRLVTKIQFCQRCAMNLKVDSKMKLYRGQVLAEKGSFQPSNILTCSLKKLKNAPPINFGDKVRFYLNTAEYIARVRLIGNNKISDCGINILQFQFDQPVVAALHDRFIIRQLSPRTTIAGGKILDANPPKIKKSDTVLIDKYKKLLIDDMEKNIRDFLDIYPYLSKGKLVQKLSKKNTVLASGLEKLHSEKVIAAVGNFYFSTESLNRYIYNISEIIRKFCFSKNFSGVAKPDILGRIDQNIANPLLDFMIDNGKLIEREGFIFLSEEQNLDQQFQQDLKKILQKIETAQYKFYNFSQLYSETGFEMDYFQQLINYLKSQNQLIVLDKGYLITKKLIEKAKRRITHYLTTNSEATVTELKQILNTTRKFIFPVLRYFDGNILERKGDYRILK